MELVDLQVVFDMFEGSVEARYACIEVPMGLLYPTYPELTGLVARDAT